MVDIDVSNCPKNVTFKKFHKAVGNYVQEVYCLKMTEVALGNY